MRGIPSGLEALERAWERAGALSPRRLSETLGIPLRPGTNQLVLRVLDRDCMIDLGSRSMAYAPPGGPDVPQHLQVLILHYLEGAGNAQLANRLVTFREFEGGAIYYPAFKARTIDVIVREFGDKPELLARVCEAIRAEKVDIGSVGFKAYFFPKMPVVVILWLGDEEVPPAANVLFDASAGKILPTEDISVMGASFCKRLVKLARG